MAPKFIFVRHGRSVSNDAFRHIGVKAFTQEEYRDPQLTEEGIEQARQAGTLLAGKKIGAIWCSPLIRAIRTAEEIFERVDCSDLYLHDNLLEIQGGGLVVHERKSKTDLKEKYGYWNMEYLPEKPAYWKDSENKFALRTRIFMLISLLADIHQEDEYVILVGHSVLFDTIVGRHMRNGEIQIMSLEEISKS